MKFKNIQVVEIPTDFILAFSSMTDENGNVLDVAIAQFEVEFYDYYGNTYTASYDGVARVNNYVEDGKVFMIFTEYPFTKPCMLKYREHWRFANDKFPDGVQDVYFSDTSGIRLKTKA